MAVSSGTAQEAHVTSQSKKAAASGWIGSALEYYDFFIYATAAAIVFPQIFFPQSDPQVAIVLSFAAFGVGYVARPIGAFVLGHWGDTHGRKQVLILCMFLMGISTMLIGVLPTYQQVGILAPSLLVFLRLVQGFAVAGEISGASSMILEHAPFGQRGFFSSFTLQGVQAGQIMAAAVFLPIAHYMDPAAFVSWGWRIPFLLSFVVIIAGYIIRREVEETPAFAKEENRGAVPKAPVIEAIQNGWDDMLRVVFMALMNVVPTVVVFGGAYATQAGYGIRFPLELPIWINVLGNITAVLLIPFVGSLSDRIGRRPVIILGALGSGLLTYGYLYAISIGSIPLAVAMSILMWGCVYQGYNAVFPSFYPELFPTRTRVSSMAVSQNIGTAMTAFFPALFATLAPANGTANVPFVIGTFAFCVTVLAAIAAWSARETYRVRMDDLGNRNAVPIDRDEYDRLREQAIAQRKAAR